MEKKQTFEEKLTRLEEIVSDIETSKKPLEELISLFKEGMGLSKECRKELAKLETEVQKVIADNNDGSVETGDMDL